MGLFISRTVNTRVAEEAIKGALLQQPPTSDEAAANIARFTASVLAGSAAAGATQYHTRRIVFAICFFLGLLGLAVAADALEWVKDAGKLYGFAETVLGVIVGYLGGEASGPTTT